MFNLDLWEAWLVTDWWYLDSFDVVAYLNFFLCFVSQIGDRSDSTVYIKSKVKAAEEVNAIHIIPLLCFAYFVNNNIFFVLVDWYACKTCEVAKDLYSSRCRNWFPNSPVNNMWYLLKVTPNLRGHPPEKKNCMHAVFKYTLRNYSCISIETFWK